MSSIEVAVSMLGTVPDVEHHIVLVTDGGFSQQDIDRVWELNPPMSVVQFDSTSDIRSLATRRYEFLDSATDLVSTVVGFYDALLAAAYAVHDG